MKGHLELFRRLEREIRLSMERIPIDAFLPSPDALPTDFPDPPVAAMPAQSRDVGGLSDDERASRERRKRQRPKKPAPALAQEQPAKLEDEIQEFINRDRRGGADTEDMSEFLGGFDPNEIPEDR